MPRTPFDVSFMPRRDVVGARASRHGEDRRGDHRARAGLGGAFDFGAEYLAALRKRCDDVGALLIFDEVQCGMGRTGHPFAANLYGVQPDMITAAKALGNGFPCAALLTSPKVSAAIKLDALGTTYGGGPMACAAIEAVIEAIESEKLLERVQRVSKYIRETCVVGPVTATRARASCSACARIGRRRKCTQSCSKWAFSPARATDPNILRLLPPFILEEQHVDLLRDALSHLV